MSTDRELVIYMAISFHILAGAICNEFLMQLNVFVDF